MIVVHPMTPIIMYHYQIFFHPGHHCIYDTCRYFLSVIGLVVLLQCLSDTFLNTPIFITEETFTMPSPWLVL